MNSKCDKLSFLQCKYFIEFITGTGTIAGNGSSELRAVTHYLIALVAYDIIKTITIKSSYKEIENV